MPFFDFLPSVDREKYKSRIVNRMNWRHRFIVDPFVDTIRDARVLDLASHDGRWCYAFAAAGAKEVVGIEGRPELVDQFARYPDEPFKGRVRLKTGDIFRILPQLNAANEFYDVVGVLGVYYHIMDHYGLLKMIHELCSKLIIIDSVFMTEAKSFIQVEIASTTSDLAAIEQFPGQKNVPVGIASQLALEHMAASLGYSVKWLDWHEVPAAQRAGLKDYFRTGRHRRFTCALRPES